MTIRKYLGKKNAAFVLAIVVALAAVLAGTTAYLISQTEPVLNTFLSGVDPYGSITLTKSVEHPYGDDYVIPEDIRFRFEIDLGNDNAGKSFSGYIADDNGVVTLNIPDGTSVTLDEIPAGLDVVVSEVDIPNGFSVKGDNERTLTVAKARDTKTDYINEYVPDPADNDITLIGEKKIEGRKWKDTDEFKFILERYDGKKWVKVAEKSATKESKTFDFTQELQSVSFDETGTYLFRVSEAAGSIGGVTYDTTVSYFDVVITDDGMDGKLDISEVTSTSSKAEITQDEETGAYSVSLAFTNDYAPSGSAAIQIDITKELTDNSGQTLLPSGFEFGLYNGDDLIAQSEATSAAGLTSIKCVFGPEDIGDHHWTLKEIDGEQAGITYDDKEYDLQVSVVDNGDGTISAYVYDYEDRVISVDTGNDSQDNGDTETSDSSGSTETDGNDQAASGDGGENGSSDAQTETDDASGNDNEEETITSVPSGATDTYDAKFTNSYDPDDAALVINGDKELDGRNIRTGEFRFDIYSTDSTYSTEGIDPSDTVSNTDTAGAFKFSLSYSKVGTYYYVVSENDSDQLKGVTYDDSKYFIKVTVTDAGGALEANAVIADQSGAESDIVFTNKYVPGSCTSEIKGMKILEGKTLQSGQFRFILYSADSTFAAGDPLGEVTNAENGSFSFDEISYSRAGNYYYIVRESSEDPVKGVTYDSTEYRIKISVTDDGNGYLKASQTITAVRDGTSKAADNVIFTNIYSAAYATLDFRAIKTLSGGTLKSGMFTFDLYKADESFNKTGSAVMSVKNDSDGNVYFHDVRFDSEGTKYYVMKEDTSSERDGITYDKSEYGITVDVTDNGSGQLIATIRSIKKIGSGEVRSITFVNKAGNGTGGGRSPKTGDTSMLLIWLVIFLLSLEGMAVTGILHKRSGLHLPDDDE